MTIKYEDVKADDNWQISLTKLTGKKIADIRGYITTEFGGYTFEVTYLVFDDGTTMGFEGEHDLPYLVDFPTQSQPNFDDDTLGQLYHESNDDE